MARASSSIDSPDVQRVFSAGDISTSKKPDLTRQSSGKTTCPESAEDKQPFKFVSYRKLEAAIDTFDFSEMSAPECKDTLGLLKELQYEHICIEEQYRKEWSEMKLRYLQKFQPLYRRRWLVLTGHTEESAQKIEDSLETVPQPSDATVDTPPVVSGTQSSEETGTIKLPGFWLKAMQNHPLLDEMIEESDIPILEYLEDIRFKWIDPKDQTSFQLDFIFNKNPFFKNVLLSKTYYLEPSDENDEESVLSRTVGTDIQWYKGKNVTEKSLIRRQRHRRTNATRVVCDTVKVNSFFNFFKTYEIPCESQLQELTEEEVSELEMILEAEFELGAVIRDKIIPRAIGWYVGVENDDLQSEDVNIDDFDGDHDETDESSEDKD